MKFAFFGTPAIAVEALNEMESFGFIPSLIVCNPDAPVGRKHVITAPPTKVWAKERNIEVLQTSSLKDREALTQLTATEWDFFVVFAYGKLLPQWLIELPKYGTINAHPSLLPKLRGASPIRSTLLTDLGAAGVTIIQMDAELDHGPILYQQTVNLYNQPIPGRELDRILSLICGDLLVHVMRELQLGNISPTPQNHTEATYCTKITKDMAELQLDPHHLPTGAEALAIYCKICAFDGWPEAYFLHQGKRVKIKSARLLKDSSLELLRVVPEGKSETDFAQFLAST
jgi:methionyl-tRNA formyltransferase